MLEFDEEKALALIMEETSEDEELSRDIMNQLKTFREELQPYVNAWINGEKPNFEFHGMSIEETMQILQEPYVLAFANMSLILDNPEKEIEFLRTTDFRRL